MDIGRAIKDIRHEKHISQENLAMDSNLSRKYIHTVESVNGNPTILVLEKIALVFNIKVSEIIIRAESY